MRATLQGVSEQAHERTSGDCLASEATALAAAHAGKNGSEAADAPEVPEGFNVVDADTANWVVRKITGCDDEEKRIEEFAAKELSRVRRDREFFLFRYGRQLEEWGASEIAKLKGRRKTIRLPAGSLCFRHENAKLVIDNDLTVLEWARQHCPQAVHTSERLSRTVLKEHFEATGELPPAGVHVEPEQERFRIG